MSQFTPQTPLQWHQLRTLCGWWHGGPRRLRIARVKARILRRTLRPVMLLSGHCQRGHRLYGEERFCTRCGIAVRPPRLTRGGDA